VRGERVGHERGRSDRSTDAHRHHRPEPVGDHAPQGEGEHRRQRAEDADDAHVGQGQIEPVDVDEGEQRHGRDHPAAVEALGHRDPPQDDARTEGGDGLAGGEPMLLDAADGPQPEVAGGAGDADRAGDGDGRRATEGVGHDPAGHRGERRGAGPGHADDTEQAPEEPRRIHAAPQAQVERAAHGHAHPVDGGQRDGDDRRGLQDEDDQRRGAEGAQEPELPWRPGSHAAGEGAEQIGDERRGAERRQTDGLEAASAGDRRQQGGDHRHRDTDPDGHEQVQRKVASDSTLLR
jgi:hypothetical protein